MFRSAPVYSHADYNSRNSFPFEIQIRVSRHIFLREECFQVEMKLPPKYSYMCAESRIEPDIPAFLRCSISALRALPGLHTS